MNTRVFFQGISYLMVFWFCFSCLSKSENLILVDCGESNWPVAGFVSDSGYYSPGTNTPAATHCGKRFMPPKKSKKYMYNGAPNHWDVTQTKLKIKPIKVEKIWKWILSLRVLVAYLDISDSKEAERTHQKEMGKVQEYIRHIRQKKCVSKLQNSDNSSQGYKKKTNNYEVGNFV